MVKKNIVLVIICFLFYSCRTIHNKNHFTLINYKSDTIPIKTGGYYYSVFERDSVNEVKVGKGIYMKVLLNNNTIHTVRNGYGYNCGEMVDLDCEFKMSEKLLDDYQKADNINRNKKYDIWNWGKYSVKNDTIRLQWFYNKFGEYYLVEEVGVILDSTSFKIIKEIDYGKKTSQKVDKLFKFKFYPVDNLYDDVPLFDVILK